MVVRNADRDPLVDPEALAELGRAQDERQPDERDEQGGDRPAAIEERVEAQLAQTRRGRWAEPRPPGYVDARQTGRNVPAIPHLDGYAGSSATGCSVTTARVPARV